MNQEKGNTAGTAAGPGGGACLTVGSWRGWKHKEPLGGGPVGRPEWTRPEVGLAEEHGWCHQRTGWYYIGVRGAHRDQFNRASRTNCQQASQPGQNQQDVRKRNEPEGANTMPQVRESGSATVYAKARPEHASQGTTPKTRLPVLLG